VVERGGRGRKAGRYCCKAQAPHSHTTRFIREAQDGKLVSDQSSPLQHFETQESTQHHTAQTTTHNSKMHHYDTATHCNTRSDRDIVTHMQARGWLMMMIAFITIRSGLVPLIEGLCVEIRGFEI